MRSSHVRRSRSKRVTNRRRPARNKKRLNLIKPLLALVCLGILGYTVHWVLHTPRLRITKASVKGLSMLSPTAIWQDVHSAHGRNILTIDVKAIRKRILRHPEVADVKIGRKLPHTLVIAVTERKPAAVLACCDNFYLIDSSATVFRKVDTFDMKLPLIQLPLDTPPAVGRPLRHPLVRPAMACLTESTKDICQVKKISVDQSGNMCLNIGSSFFVKLGQPVDISRKLSVLRSTLEAKPGIAAKVLYFDISCPERPVWMPKYETDEVQAAKELQDSANAVVH